MRLLGKRKACPSVTHGFILIGVFIGVSSCTFLSETPSILKNVPPRSREPGELVKSLRQRADRFRSLRALAKVRYWGPDGRAGFQEAVLVRRPDRLRFETLSNLGAVLIVTVAANEITGFHPREGLFYRGKSSKENLLRYTQIPLELEEITALLLGLPPARSQEGWAEEDDSVSREDGRGSREVVTFYPSTTIPTQWERFDPDGERTLTAVFSDFGLTSAGPFPLKISLEDHAHQRYLEIHYQEPELNIELPYALFVQQKPDHVREVPLESLGG